MNPAMAAHTAAMGQKVSAPMTTAAPKPKTRRSVKFSTSSDRSVCEDSRRGATSPGSTGRNATAALTMPRAKHAPSSATTGIILTRAPSARLQARPAIELVPGRN